MTYGPYGLDNPKAPCIYRKVPNALLTCQKDFLKAFMATIIVREDYYPEYCQHDDGQTFTVCKPGVSGKEVVCNNY